MVYNGRHCCVHAISWMAAVVDVVVAVVYFRRSPTESFGPICSRPADLMVVNEYSPVVMYLGRMGVGP